MSDELLADMKRRGIDTTGLEDDFRFCLACWLKATPQQQERDPEGIGKRCQCKPANLPFQP